MGHEVFEYPRTFFVKKTHEQIVGIRAKSQHDGPRGTVFSSLTTLLFWVEVTGHMSRIFTVWELYLFARLEFSFALEHLINLFK